MGRTKVEFKMAMANGQRMLKDYYDCLDYLWVVRGSGVRDTLRMGLAM